MLKRIEIPYRQSGSVEVPEGKYWVIVQAKSVGPTPSALRINNGYARIPAQVGDIDVKVVYATSGDVVTGDSASVEVHYFEFDN